MLIMVKHRITAFLLTLPTHLVPDGEDLVIVELSLGHGVVAYG